MPFLSKESCTRNFRDADLPVLGFPALTGRRNISSVSISSSTPPTPPTPVPTATTTSVEEPKASSPRGAAYLFQRVSKFRRKPSSKSTSSKDGVEAATTNTIASGKPPKSGGRASASLPVNPSLSLKASDDMATLSRHLPFLSSLQSASIFVLFQNL